MSLKRSIITGLKHLIVGKTHFPSNVIITAPHGSSKIPLAIFPHLQSHYQVSPRLLLNYSDFGTKYLIEDIPAKQKVIAPYGRLIGDPNRARDSEDIIRLKDFGGLPIFREKFEKRLTKSWLRAFWLRKLLLYSYEPFHCEVFNTIERAVKDPENEGKPIILIDVHDTGNRMLGPSWREDKTRKGLKMPPVILANAMEEEVEEGRFGTAPMHFVEDFREKLADKMELDEKDIEINSLFKGSHVIKYYSNVMKNRRVRKVLNGKTIIALQIEFNRDLYLDEVSQRPIGWKLRSVKNAFTETICEMCNDNI